MPLETGGRKWAAGGEHDSSHREVEILELCAGLGLGCRCWGGSPGFSVSNSSCSVGMYWLSRLGEPRAGWRVGVVLVKAPGLPQGLPLVSVACTAMCLARRFASSLESCREVPPIAD